MNLFECCVDFEGMTITRSEIDDHWQLIFQMADRYASWPNGQYKHKEFTVSLNRSVSQGCATVEGDGETEFIKEEAERVQRSRKALRKGDISRTASSNSKGTTDQQVHVGAQSSQEPSIQGWYCLAILSLLYLLDLLKRRICL
jgi:hypothetical protein